MSSLKHFGEKAKEDNIICEPCLSDNLKVQATYFCKTCDDPELLCEACAKYHSKNSKLFKEHELSKIIKDLRKR